MASKENITAIGLLRHGATEWNLEHRIQGRKDSPLTPEGIRATLAWLPLLRQKPWFKVFASDLGRAKHTAKLLAEGLDLDLVLDNRLREMNWGTWEGLTLEELRKDHARELSKQVQRGWMFRAPGGESRREVLARTRTALFDLATNHKGKDLLVVSHQGAIKCILYDLLKRAFLPDEKNGINKNALHLLEVENEITAINRLNIMAEGSL